MKLGRLIKNLFLITCIVSVLFSLPVYADEEAQALAAPVLTRKSEYVLAWNRVNGAGSYEVQLNIDTGSHEQPKLKVFTVSGPAADLSDYAAAGSITCAVRAVPRSKDRNHRESAWTVFDQALEPAEDNTVQGYFHRVSQRVTFTCLDGKAAQGWQKISGFWYYFDPENDNEAAKGWKTVGADRFYFDRSCHMLTGWQEIDGYRYCFCPAIGQDFGKMLTGKQELTPNTFFYFRTEGDIHSEQDGETAPEGSLDEEKTKEMNPDMKIPYSVPISDRKSTDSSNAPGQQETADQVEETSGWISNPDGSCSFVSGDGTKKKNCWYEESGLQYYFNSQGIMLTGWQYLEDEWRYFAVKEDPSGNPEGAYIKEKQKTEESSGEENGGDTESHRTKEDEETVYSIRQCGIRVNVTEESQGTVRSVDVTEVTGSDIVKKEYSLPYENWRPGMRVKETVTFRAEDGFSFSQDCVYSCRNARIVGNTGSGKERTVCLEFTAVAKLSTPEIFYSSEESVLCWMKPKNAVRFRVTVNNGFERRYTFYTTDPKIDLTDYGDPLDEEKKMSLEICALGPEDSTGYLDSEKFTVSDAVGFIRDHTVKGEFETTGGKLRFLTDSGEYLKGWQEILGKWYHFGAGGYAEEEGWYQDIDGNWYYFDHYHSLVTGSLSIDGNSYFLNDGSVSDFPVGALINR